MFHIIGNIKFQIYHFIKLKCFAYYNGHVVTDTKLNTQSAFLII